ncbi:MAG: lipopolysaccharide biosynthesis protein RfbH [Bacteroidota bacterium]|jgi:CDP-6-deoxy-D-xylo-4-hexulose-3-dehydrase
MSKKEKIKTKIKELIHEYYLEVFSGNVFVAGETHIPVSGKVTDSDDMFSIAESGLDAWYTTGRFNDAFEKKLASYIGIKKVLTVNSGSSANLIAFATLTCEELGDRAIKPGDEVITVAVSFPTTINPMISYGAIPVFIDVEIPTYNIDVKKIESAITPKTKAIMVAHTLGNPFNAIYLKEICEKHRLWLIEDCCDAIGATIEGKHVGTFGDIGTLSFYPAHHITMGEGGAVFTNNVKLNRIAESYRDWGRDCWCAPGKDNTCGKRFGWCLGSLPDGYDHKYIYSKLGFNLKITDMQAALGLSQLNKLDSFIQKRKHNFSRLRDGLMKFETSFILPEPTNGSEPSWFGFLITIKPESNIKRIDLIDFLCENKIGTRLLFSGDIRKQPYFKNVVYRQVGSFENTELIVKNTFWIGVAPMISDEMIDYVIDKFNVFVNIKSKNE